MTKLTNLQWLHTFAAGQDRLWFPALLESSCIITKGQVGSAAPARPGREVQVAQV